MKNNKTTKMKRGDIVRPIPSKRNNWMVALAIFPGLWLWPGIAAMVRGHINQVLWFIAILIACIFLGPVAYLVGWVWGICYALHGHRWCRDYLSDRGWKELF